MCGDDRPDPASAIELRRYVDPAVRPGKDHLVQIDGKATCHVDRGDAGLPHYANLMRDIVERTQAAMPQARADKVCELALKAQARASTG